MRESEEDLSLYNEVQIPEEMRGDPLCNSVLDEMDCAPGPCRVAALKTYNLVQELYTASQTHDFSLHPHTVAKAYHLVRERQRASARKFTLLHVLLRGIYAQLRCEQQEEYGPFYNTIRATNRLIDETIRRMDSKGERSEG